MMRFKLHEPSSIDEACQLLGHYGETSQAIAGGTELLLVMKLGVVSFEHLVDLQGLASLRGISRDETAGWISIGSAATHREVEHSPLIHQYLPAFAELERDLANVRVRNTGTVGGNLCFADPHSDPATLLLSLDAELILQKDGATRAVSIQDFFQGAYETVREHDELLVEIRIPPLDRDATAVFERFCYYERPTANVAVAVRTVDGGEKVAQARIAVGSASPRPVRLPELEKYLVETPTYALGDDLDGVIAEAVQPLEILGDLLGAEDYKRHLVRVLLRRAVARALNQAQPGSRRTGPQRWS